VQSLAGAATTHAALRHSAQQHSSQAPAQRATAPQARHSAHLLGVAARQEEVGDGGGLVGPVGVHAGGLPVERLPDLDDGVPLDLEAARAGEEEAHLEGVGGSRWGWRLGLEGLGLML